MIELGYMARRISCCPQWLDATNVENIYSVVNCISADFCDYIPLWKHNRYWFFDSPGLIQGIASDQSMDTAEMTLVYYRGYHLQFDANSNKWNDYGHTAGIQSSVFEPPSLQLLGYDIVTYSMQNAPECSPLSCNNVAAEVRVNRSCLVDSLEGAIDLLENGAFNHTEPGPFRIVAVHATEWPPVTR